MSHVRLFLRRLAASFHRRRAEADLAEQRDAGIGQILEIRLGHAVLDHRRAGQRQARAAGLPQQQRGANGGQRQPVGSSCLLGIIPP